MTKTMFGSSRTPNGKSLAGRPRRLRKPSMATKASDRKFHDAMWALMLDHQIYNWYQDRDTGEWYIKTASEDGPWRKVDDIKASLRDFEVSGKSLHTACWHPIPAKNKDYAKRMAATFPLFAGVVVDKPIAAVRHNMPVESAEELLQLFGN